MSSTLPTANLSVGWKGASTAVVQAIKGAAARTGVSFDYLMDKAQQESSFNPTAKAKTSSATGLFQFIDSTWLAAVRDHGAQFGLGDMAAKISGSGKVADAATKREILALRNDPEVAANIVAATTRDNADFLENSLGDKVGETDLYLAHFLGLGGANKFLKARQDNPMAAAADLFPAAAGANKNVFYGPGGRKRSLDEVYDFFARKMGDDGSDPINGVMTAKAMPARAAGSQPTSTVFLPDLDRIDSAHLANWGQSQVLDAMLAGITAYGNGDHQNRIGGNLLSPYTAFTLAKLNSPDESDMLRGDNARQQDRALFG